MDPLSTAPHREIVLEPSRGWLHIEWRELWEYRDLLVLLVRRDFLARYQQTALGPLWHLLQPVLTMAVFVFFGRAMGISTDGIPAPLFYLCGLLGWNYFAQNLTAGSGTFVNNAALFSKVWFPRLVVPVAAITSNLVSFALQLVPFFAFFACYVFCTADAGVQFTGRALLTPLPLLHIAALSLGISLWMAAATARYRDLIHLNQYLVQLWMFATPVIYPLSRVPQKWAWLMWVNPVAAPVENLRWCLLGRGTFEPSMTALSAGVTLVLLVSGIVAFENAARSAVDTI